MDVKTEFLNGDLDEDIYMEQSEGFVLPDNEQKGQETNLITLSSMKSKFVALSSVDQEAKWLRYLLLEVPLAKYNVPKILIHCNSQDTLARAYNKVYNGKFRQLDLRHSFVRKLIKN
ncbi:uncharacterized protein LOC127130719 [Lathyrus oleraceus]|uniref:uncharacterized protein LOC127130719 n=1 Tax=Pisum sativum TaxID=3888 RepID=UPI0021D1DE62|nr:uncharacterized protein LOC127130719 [Pisum sativum]